MESRPVDRSAVTLIDGSPVTEIHLEIDSATGQQKAYVVLSAEERAKGFVRPVRRSYTHVGIRPRYPLRNLTEEEKRKYLSHEFFGIISFEAYPENESSLTGRFWTKQQLESGCGRTTTMGIALAETYARDPGFYGSTFCATCREHFHVDEFVWEGTDERVGS